MSETQPALSAVRGSSPAESVPAAERFWLWVLATLQLPVRRTATGGYEFAVPLEQRADFAEREAVGFVWGPEGGPAAEGADSPAEILAVDSPLGAQLLARLQRRGAVFHAAPRGQPVSIHELAPHLFAPYRVEGGSVRLSGCSLEDRPLLRYSYRIQDVGSAGSPRLEHVYAWPHQQPVEPELLAALRGDDVLPLASTPPRVSEAEVACWLVDGARQGPQLGDERRADLLLTTAIWCKRAVGKLLFELGDSTAECSFDLWAQPLVDGAVLPPPFRCAATGRPSYHLAATDDGRITVAESLGRCALSGRRVLDCELETCAVTGQRVLGGFLSTCAVCGERVLADELVTCTSCREQVSPHAVSGGLCRACRSLQHVSQNDPRLARILGEYPKLDRWRRWQLAETARVYVLTARSLMRQLLLVLDKDSLEPARLAERFCLARDWPEISPARWDEFLG